MTGELQCKIEVIEQRERHAFWTTVVSVDLFKVQKYPKLRKVLKKF